MAANITLTTYDRLNKVTSLQIQADDAVTGGNIQSLADAVDAVIIGSAIKATKSVVTVVDAGAAGPSTDQDADRGSKWLFRTQDGTTGTIYTNELGTADNAVLPSASSDFIDLTAGVGLALKTAWETVWRSPAGNSGVLLSVQQVNRALN